LAVVDGLHRARFFVLGCKELIVAVDHKPLLKIFGDRSLNDIENPRLRNLKEKTLQFQFKIIHLAGAKNRAAEAISRHPSQGSDSAEGIHLPDDIAVVESSNTLHTPKKTLVSPADEGLRLAAISTLSTVRVITWDTVKQETNSDAIMLSLLHIVKSGIPTLKTDMPPTLHVYFPHCEHLWTVDGVIMYKSRIIIPPSLCDSILEALHAAHQGVSTMTS